MVHVSDHELALWYDLRLAQEKYFFALYANFSHCNDTTLLRKPKKVHSAQRFQRSAHGQTEQRTTYLPMNLFYGITNVLHKKNTFSHCMRIFSHCMRTFSHAIRIFSHRFSHRIFKEASKAAYWPEGVGNGL